MGHRRELIACDPDYLDSVPITWEYGGNGIGKGIILGYTARLGKRKKRFLLGAVGVTFEPLLSVHRETQKTFPGVFAVSGARERNRERNPGQGKPPRNAARRDCGSRTF
jgi:hypothetical protein